MSVSYDRIVNFTPSKKYKGSNMNRYICIVEYRSTTVY